MITQEISIHGKKFRLNLTDQIIMQTKHLKSLYNTAYEDPQSFEELSSEISDTINQISEGADPRASDNELDDVIQAIMDAVEKKTAETERTLKEKHPKKIAKSSKKGKKPASKRSKSKK